MKKKVTENVKSTINEILNNKKTKLYWNMVTSLLFLVNICIEDYMNKVIWII